MDRRASRDLHRTGWLWSMGCRRQRGRDGGRFFDLENVCFLFWWLFLGKIQHQWGFLLAGKPHEKDDLCFLKIKIINQNHVSYTVKCGGRKQDVVFGVSCSWTWYMGLVRRIELDVLWNLWSFLFCTLPWFPPKGFSTLGRCPRQHNNLPHLLACVLREVFFDLKILRFWKFLLTASGWDNGLEELICLIYLSATCSKCTVYCTGGML